MLHFVYVNSLYHHATLLQHIQKSMSIVQWTLANFNVSILSHSNLYKSSTSSDMVFFMLKFYLSFEKSLSLKSLY